MKVVTLAEVSYTERGEKELYFDDGTFFGTIEENAGNTCGRGYYFRLKDIYSTNSWDLKEYFENNPNRIDEVKEFFSSYSCHFGKIILSEDEVYEF